MNGVFLDDGGQQGTLHVASDHHIAHVQQPAPDTAGYGGPYLGELQVELGAGESGLRL